MLDAEEFVESTRDEQFIQRQFVRLCGDWERALQFLPIAVMGFKEELACGWMRRTGRWRRGR